MRQAQVVNTNKFKSLIKYQYIFNQHKIIKYQHKLSIYNDNMS